MANILIGVTGGIAAYKIPSLVSVLVDEGHTVRVIMTEASKKFVGPLTFSALSHQPVYDDAKEFGSDGSICHIELAQWADVFAIAPMTAHTGNKILLNLADNLLTSTALAYTKPLIMFPAMNSNMWDKVKHNYQSSGRGLYVVLSRLEDFWKDYKILNGCPRVVVQPASGKMACGSIGEGKLVSTSVMLDVIKNVLYLTI
jgi:phosphopantothenoylcysteine decarboxylase/phosphopantothenate--cysteine ligase